MAAIRGSPFLGVTKFDFTYKEKMHKSNCEPMSEHHLKIIRADIDSTILSQTTSLRQEQCKHFFAQIRPVLAWETIDLSNNETTLYDCCKFVT